MRVKHTLPATREKRAENCQAVYILKNTRVHCVVMYRLQCVHALQFRDIYRTLLPNFRVAGIRADTVHCKLGVGFVDGVIGVRSFQGRVAYFVPEPGPAQQSSPQTNLPPYRRSRRRDWMRGGGGGGGGGGGEAG
eukprot:7398994-Pyramimonas_sp.AAC.1